VLAVALLMFSLTACGGNDNQDDLDSSSDYEYSDDIVVEESDGEEDDGVYIDDEYSEVTIYANGGTIYMDSEEDYDCDLDRQRIL